MLIYHKDPKGLTEKEIYPLDTHLTFYKISAIDFLMDLIIN